MDALGVYRWVDGRLPHKIADDAFKALWMKARRADIGLTQAHQIKLVRRMLKGLRPADRAMVQAKRGLPPSAGR